MKIRKAVIPAAGFGTRFLPVTKALPKEILPIIDIPNIQYIVEEAVKSGIEEVIIIISKRKEILKQYFDRDLELEKLLGAKDADIVHNIANLAKITYVYQDKQLGLGHAILCAKEVIGDEPFAVMLGDDLMYSDNIPVLKQLMDVYYATNKSVLGCNTVAKENVCKYGIITPVANDWKISDRLYKIAGVVEKPKIHEAKSQLAILGRYVFSNKILAYLEKQIPLKKEIMLTDAICDLNDDEAVYAYDFIGSRYDIGDKFGYIQAIIDYSLRHPEFKEKTEKYIKDIANKLE